MPPITQTPPSPPRSLPAPSPAEMRSTRESGTPSANAHPPPGSLNRPPQRMKANITIATLNVNGYAAPSSNMSGIDKWSRINRTINDNNIAILAIQETHLDPTLIQNVTTCFGSRLEVLTSQHPDNPRATAGVAFVINKALIRPKEYKLHELIPGRVAALKVKWLENEDTLLFNVYAPNARDEQVNFWESIDMMRRAHNLRRPDFMLGDFNVTEDKIDRAPAHLDDPAAADALRNLRHILNIQDSWRISFPNERSFTYRANANGSQIQSRLDRIYTTSTVNDKILEWKTIQTAVPTDHSLVLAKFSPTSAPFIGKGRWTWRPQALNDIMLMDKIEDRGILLRSEIQRLQEMNTPREQANPQTLWHSFKDDIKKLAKESIDKAYHRKTSKIKKLREEIRTLANHPNIDRDERIRTNEAFAANELAYLEKITARDRKDLTKASLANHGERLGGPWSAISKEKKPRDLILQLKIPDSNPPRFERCTRRMANLARNYHENLQYEGVGLPYDHQNYETNIKDILEEIPWNQRLTNEVRNNIEWRVEADQIREAMSLAKNGSATGIDGLPYELWKELDRTYVKAEEEGSNGFDIADTLAVVFQDIQDHGVDERSNFALGWMCPIYKKKDKKEISNYRPITLLNTDYKLLTKVLAIKLMNHIPAMIHPNQAGFIPNRSIFDHIRLAKSIISYAEVMEIDGTIVALDQEKAYDKIRHEYLWETMNYFNLPLPFTNTVRALYQHAHTRVAINGELSKPFQVTRGVRQGDPLSCALFDLAIEPLACKLRNDPTLKGFAAPGLEEKILVNMFADDTTLYLNKDDRFDQVELTLTKWCQVSGAKFNIEKTEIIPLGTAEHRAEVVTSRKINPEDNRQLDNRIKVALDGEAIRLLGAWIGNGVDDLTPWEPIIDQIKKDLERWLRIHPTVHGKRLIAQAIIGGRTQYLAKVQGMPPRIEDAIQKIIQEFIWDNEPIPRLKPTILELPLEEGGLNLLSVKTRNEAIEIMWLKSYLNFSPSRPTWAIITDILINASAPPNISPLGKLNTYMQSWDPPTRGLRTAYLNNDIIRMINTAKKYDTNLDALRIAPKINAQLPAWYHIKAIPSPLSNIASRCLLKKHRINTVADLLRTSERAQPDRINSHVPNLTCTCVECAKDRLKGCRNPHECAKEALKRISEIAPKFNPLIGLTQRDDFSLTPSRDARKIAADENNDKIMFDAEIACKTDITECFRIFTGPNKISQTPVRRRHAQGLSLPNQTVTVYTDGACFNNGKENAQCGSGIWINSNSNLNTSLRIPGSEQSNQVGELAAVIKTAIIIPTFCPLIIKTDSKYVIQGLTSHLKTWENKGWIGIKNAKLFRKAAHLLRRRTAPTFLEWVKGHNGDTGNEESDRLAKEGAEKDTPDELPLDIPPEYDLQGAKLSTMTQALAYQGIRTKNTCPSRPTTVRNLNMTKSAIREITLSHETSPSIWKGLRKKSIRPRVQQFLYKTMHGTYKIGDYWSHIPGYETRGQCSRCNTTENMEHILTSCTTEPVNIIWTLAKETWPHEPELWPEISIGTILGCGNLTNPEDDEQDEGEEDQEDRQKKDNKKGMDRLRQILISESAHLIWVLRCDRVINDKTHTSEEIKSKWLRAINARLTDDKIIATKVRRGKISAELVTSTWQKALQKSSNIPRDWIEDREVLVGRRVRPR